MDSFCFALIISVHGTFNKLYFKAVKAPLSKNKISSLGRIGSVGGISIVRQHFLKIKGGVKCLRKKSVKK